ncbi:MAG: phosphate ABC transporter permease subunit PstC [Arenicellales bacterium WSBS_2016_MAG_OTU3]
MNTFGITLVVLLGLTVVGYQFGRRRAFGLTSANTSGLDSNKLHSLPSYYGTLTALWAAIPALFLFGIWISMEQGVITNLVVGGLPDSMQSMPEAELGLVVNDIQNLASGNIVSSSGLDGVAKTAITDAAIRFNQYKSLSRIALLVATTVLAFVAAVVIIKRIRRRMRARTHVETIIKGLLIACSSIAILTTIGIVLSVFFESIRFFQKIPPLDFLLGLEWSPQTAIRADQVGSSGAFGAIPLFVGTLLISFIAMLIAVPIGLMAAIYLSEYASLKMRAFAKPLLEILAGIPTVVYGFFAALTVAPFIRNVGESIGLEVASESALAAGLVMGIMIIPFVSSLSDDVINAVPQSLRDGSFGLGATHSETIRNVIMPAALPGIAGAVLLAISRAIGETMIVVMAAGLAANMTANPLQAVTTVTVQIVTLLVGDQEFDSAKTLAAFALGLMLFIVTLALNVLGLYIVRKYREQYD